MEKNKYDFINELLDQNKFNITQKERILKLIIQEIKNDNQDEHGLIGRIKKIEEKLKLDIDSIRDGQNRDIEANKTIQNDLPKFINSTNISKFLSAYNQNPILKYTCHEIDELDIIDEINNKCGTTEYNVIKHQELIEKEYNKLIKGYFIHQNIKNLILVYLTGNSFSGKFNTWSSDKIRINWKSPELIEWSKNNPEIVPNPGDNLINKLKNKGFAFKVIKSGLTIKRIKSFSKLVIHFKNLFHLRGDNPLIDLIEVVNEKENWNDKINFEINGDDFWNNLELFTDVDKIIQAYKVIIRFILEVEKKAGLEKPNVILMFKEDENSNIIFSIHHKNTVYQKSLNNTIERIGERQTKLIRNQINGLCEFYLKADFGHNQFAEVNLWNGQKRKGEILDIFEGVNFILKFRK